MALTDLGSRLWRHVPQSLQRPLRLAAGATRRWIDQGGTQLGAAIAFYTMFAVAPLLVIAIALAGYVFGVEAARGQIVGVELTVLAKRRGERVAHLGRDRLDRGPVVREQPVRPHVEHDVLGRAVDPRTDDALGQRLARRVDLHDP